MNTEQERAEFEAASRKHSEKAGYDPDCVDFIRDGEGYANPARQAAWWGWRERAALQSQQQDSLVALKQMQRYFGKWPEFVPAHEYQHNAIAAIKTMNDALAGVALQSQYREVIIEALKCAQNNECGPRRPFGSSDPDSDDYACDAFMWDYYQKAIDHARRIEDQP